MESIEKIVARQLLEIKAVRLNTDKPFTWASGWKSPIYCDNRKILSYPKAREIIFKNLAKIIEQNYKNVDVIAGVATGAIAWGVLVAEVLGKPFVYVRPKPKDHGTGAQVEGDLPAGASVVVVEDLISTGASSLSAVDALQNEGAHVLGMVA
ncbi:MAG TPA: orotate phosphoribosyltransferase, partial [Bacteroidales bacterium]|nr:orotate phosphoribosyltransferase [Bacteroidales bacterium]